MTDWIYTGKVYNLSEFGYLNLNLFGGPSEAFLEEWGDEPPSKFDIQVVPHPDDKSGELWAEVQQKGAADANTTD